MSELPKDDKGNTIIPEIWVTHYDSHWGPYLQSVNMEPWDQDYLDAAPPITQYASNCRYIRAEEAEAEIVRLRDALAEAEGCFAAAEVEGLYDRINAKEFYDDGDIYGIVVRRLLPAADVIRAALQRKAGE